ncbi:MAG: Nif11-like leader peptide family natural product precursor [Pyrinomonadaceae bacterium]
MSRESFEQFRQLVLQDTVLQERLRETVDRETFVHLVVRLGEERGYAFTALDVEAAMRASQQAWLLRWI